MLLDHIAIIVSREEYLGFYEKFGFVETKRIERGAGDIPWCDIRTKNAYRNLSDIGVQFCSSSTQAY